MILSKSAVSAAAMTLLMGGASFAQEQGDATAMPKTLSTPAEKAETAEINNQVRAGNAAVDAQTDANNAQYQAQQRQYEGQKQQYQGQLQLNQAQQRDYQDRNIAYDGLRERYAAERAAYHRGAWPNRYVTWVVPERDAGLAGERVELIGGSRVGTVVDSAHAANGNVTALLVKLDNEKIVWIDAGDVRYNRADGIVITDLDRADLRHMADERL